MERGTSSGERTGIWGKLKVIPYLAYWKMFLIRVSEGLGLVRNPGLSRELFKLWWSFGIIQRNELKLCILPEAARLENVVSGVPFVSKLFSLFGGIDAVQTVALNQPFLGGNIAPNEMLGLVNPNGGQRWMSHTEMSFNATDQWCITCVVNWNGDSPATWTSLCGRNSGYTKIDIDRAGNGSHMIGFTNVANLSIQSNGGLGRLLIGKNTIVQFVANGKNSFEALINGKSVWIDSINTTSVFSSIIKGYGFSDLNRLFKGKYLVHCLKSIAPSTDQLFQEYSLLRSFFQPVPSVSIGNQVWATSNLDVVCTPQGNLIANVIEDSNVELLTNGNFEGTFTGGLAQGWVNNGATPTQEIGRIGGSAQGISRSTGDQVYKVPPATVGRWIKVSFWYKVISGTGASCYYSITTPLTQADWTYVSYYIIAAAGGIDFHSGGIGSKIIVDDVSIQNVGWFDSQNLYDYIYSNTSGATAIKELAACKAAAMWCYHSNDPNNGAVNGKIYNGFALRLWELDRISYDAANPTTPWGWRMPTQSDINSLLATLGGITAALGKIKLSGATYFSTTDNGVTNSSGLSLIGSGYRGENGVFYELYASNRLGTITQSDSNNYYATYVYGDKNIVGYVGFSPCPNGRGHSARLIKY